MPDEKTGARITLVFSVISVESEETMNDNGRQNLERDGELQKQPDAPEHSPLGGEEMPSAKSTKAPAFQFYPKDFLSDSKVQRMSLTEVGAYMLLLCHCWLEGSLPSDLRKLASIVGMKQEQFARVWPVTLEECFIVKGDRLINGRLDKERKVQAENRAKRAANGKLGGRPPQTKPKPLGSTDETIGKAKESPSIFSLHSTSADPLEEQKISSEADASKPVFSFSTIGKPATWHLRQTQLDEWIAAYPGVDVLGECRRAAAWLGANSRKTANGMPKFLVRWLGRAVDGLHPARVAVGGSRTGGNRAELQAFIDQGKP